MTDPISVAIIEEACLFREGIANALEGHEFKVEPGVRGVGDIPVRQHGIMLVILGPSPGATPDQIATSVLGRPDLRLVVLSSRLLEWEIDCALSLGVVAYLAASVSAEVLRTSLRLAANGILTISKPVEGWKGRCGARPSSIATPDSCDDEPERPVFPVAGLQNGRATELSRQEVRVLERLTMCEQNKLIAYHLNIAEATVKAHVRSILSKLHARNRMDAALWARQHPNLFGGDRGGEQNCGVRWDGGTDQPILYSGKYLNAPV